MSRGIGRRSFLTAAAVFAGRAALGMQRTAYGDSGDYDENLAWLVPLKQLQRSGCGAQYISDERYVPTSRCGKREYEPDQLTPADEPADEIAGRYSPTSRSGIRQPVYPATDRDIEFIARAIYHEARGEPPDGQKAVAAVALNRAYRPIVPEGGNKPIFPTTIEEVFRYGWGGNIENTISRTDLPEDELEGCREIAADVANNGVGNLQLEDRVLGGYALFTDKIIAFRSAAIFTIPWPGDICNGWKRFYAGTIGRHHFYEAVRK